MQTGIYVLKPSTVVIETQEEKLPIYKFNGNGAFATLQSGTKLDLVPGVYSVQSNRRVTVKHDTDDVVVVQRENPTSVARAASELAGKDTWPDPPTNITSALGVDKEAVIRFIGGKGIDL